ncbi:MAG: hydroxymethylbilane synthase [Planctomycetota bacterium]|jgi:hydroxymethylbilane synthase
MKLIRIASRASKLALVQSNYILKLLQEINPGISISIAKVTTEGDRDRSDFLYKSESVGYFTSEVEKAILQDRADLAVHSLKDLPTALTPGLQIAAIPKRESVSDALITKYTVKSLNELPPGTVVGTSSLRRISQLKHFRNDLKCVPLRGNVETRVNKVDQGQIDAAVIACAGLNRLGLSDKISVVLPPEQFITAPGQGALAVQTRSNDTELTELLTQLDDEVTRITVEAERKVLAIMQGGCSIPLGVYAKIVNDSLVMNAMIADIDGINLIKRSKTSPVNQSLDCAQQLAEELLKAGGDKILEQIRNDKTA